MFRGLFNDPHNFLYVLKQCRGGEPDLSAVDITPFDLDSELALRIRRNDVSFITKDNRLIILVEHQSTQSPSMALRLFFYYIELLQLWIKLNDVNLYGESQIPALPVPEFYVAYNGTKPLERDYSSFAFNHEGININVMVKIVDIHFENLTDVETANTLAGYSFFYKVYDEGIQQGLTREMAFTTARDECIKHGYLHGYVEKEDFIVFYKDILDYDTQLKQESEARGIMKTALKLLESGTSLQYLAETLQLSESQIIELKKAIA